MNRLLLSVALILSGLFSVIADDTKQQAPFTDELVYGKIDAPVEIIEYASLTCHHCGNFAKTVYPKLNEAYIKTGKVKFVMRHFVLNRVDLVASVVTRCGTEAQAKGLMKTFLETQENWMHSTTILKAIQGTGMAAGLTKEQMDACLQDQVLQKKIITMRDVGQKVYQVRSTPTIMVNGLKAEGDAIIINGNRVTPNSFENLKKMIDAALKATQK